jgi:hypothetical protein
MHGAPKRGSVVPETQWPRLSRVATTASCTHFKAKQKRINISSKVQPLIPVLSRHYQVSNKAISTSKEQLWMEINECQDELVTKTLVHQQRAKTGFVLRSSEVLNNFKTSNLISNPTTTTPCPCAHLDTTNGARI